jgi:hypothetical protein
MSGVEFDAEVVGQAARISIKNPKYLETIAKKLCKPILHEVVDGRDHSIGCRLPWKGSHLLSVYDGLWVYYCELKVEEPTREGPAQ